MLRELDSIGGCLWGIELEMGWGDGEVTSLVWVLYSFSVDVAVAV